jgi:hypothetical protein
VIPLAPDLGVINHTLRMIWTDECVHLLIGVTDTTEIRWRGHGGGADLAAGLATGLMIGGLVVAPRYYDGSYPYYGGLYPAGYVGRSAIAHRGGRPLLVALSPGRSDERNLSGPRWPTALLPVVRHYYLGEFQQR